MNLLGGCWSSQCALCGGWSWCVVYCRRMGCDAQQFSLWWLKLAFNAGYLLHCPLIVFFHYIKFVCFTISRVTRSSKAMWLDLFTSTVVTCLEETFATCQVVWLLQFLVYSFGYISIYYKYAYNCNHCANPTLQKFLKLWMVYLKLQRSMVG